MNNFYKISENGNRFGGPKANAAMLRFWINQGKRVVVATHNPGQTIKELHLYFPRALFSIVGNWGVSIHERKNLT